MSENERKEESLQESSTRIISVLIKKDNPGNTDILKEFAELQADAFRPFHLYEASDKNEKITEIIHTALEIQNPEAGITASIENNRIADLKCYAYMRQKALTENHYQTAVNMQNYEAADIIRTALKPE